VNRRQPTTSELGATALATHERVASGGRRWTGFTPASIDHQAGRGQEGSASPLLAALRARLPASSRGRSVGGPGEPSGSAGPALLPRALGGSGDGWQHFLAGPPRRMRRCPP